MKTGPKISRAARQLLSRPDFLFQVCDTVGRLGVVGEQRNRLVVFLAGITKKLDEPVSVIVTGPSSSGKSNLLRTTLRMFPPRVVIERASLSGKAPAYAKEPLAGRILYLQEFKGGKDAQYLIRLLQSEREIKHEATTVTGKKRGTLVARRKGTPVVLTTTTEPQIFHDDATRFLSVAVDESPEQTLAIAKARITRAPQRLRPPLQVWRHAVARIKREKGDFPNPPEWLLYVAERLPLDQVRVRRDWGCFLTLCQAIALCRRGVSSRPVDITFADYIVAYKILEPALAGTSSGIHPDGLALLQAVEKLGKTSRTGVTPKAIADYLNWKPIRVYTHLELPDKHSNKVIEYQPGTHERNQKFVVAVPGFSSRHFLPSPGKVLKNNKTLPDIIRFVDPLTGKRKFLRRK